MKKRIITISREFGSGGQKELLQSAENSEAADVLSEKK